MHIPATRFAAAVALLLWICACGDADERAAPDPDPGSAPAAAGAEIDLAGHWVAPDAADTLTFYRDGRVAIDPSSPMQEGTEPLSGTYTVQEDGRVRLDFPSFAPVFVTLRGEDALSFMRPGGTEEENVTYRKASDLPEEQRP